MGKTVLSYRMAVEFEISKWKGFRDTLRADEDREAFDAIMDMVRSNASAGSCACNPILFEPMAMSILLSQQKRLKTLQKKIDALLASTLPIENPGPQRP